MIGVELRGRTVELVARKRLRVQADSLRVAKDVEWYPLPADFEVVGGEGEPVRPSPGRQLFVTVETFNPFHGLSPGRNGVLRHGARNFSPA